MKTILKINFEYIIYVLIILNVQFSSNLYGDDIWKNFNIGSNPSFDYPVQLIMDPKSLKGEYLWYVKLQDEQEKFIVESIGFDLIPENLLINGETEFKYMLRKLNVKYGKSITYFSIYTYKFRHIILIVSIRNGIKTLHKIDMIEGNYNSKQLIISFPHKYSKKFDPWMRRIEGSWKPCGCCK
ncbi:MAG: hypothetical protein HZB23_06660 [Deltaproteobacteria bacterium]|nr:hypothetical protein [Deltaproteobacteria bacterium]